METLGYYLVAWLIISFLLGYVSHLIHKDTLITYLTLIGLSFFNLTIIDFKPIGSLEYFGCQFYISPYLSFTTIAVIATIILGKTNHKIGALLFYLQWLIVGTLAFLAFAPSFC